MKRFRNTIILSVLLALTLCVGAQATENTMLKVGLKYGTNALFTARLQNYNDTLSGSGYEFGYYDADRSFVPLAATDEQRITVTVDSNAYVSGGVCYETRPTNYSTILGAYHIELLTAFGSYEEALAVAQSYPKGFVAYIDGAYRVRVGNHASYDESARVLSETDVLAYGAQIVTPSSTGVVVSVTDTDTVLFEFDCSGLRSLGVRPRSVSGEKTVTWFSGYRYYGGFEYQRVSGGNINVINVVDLEDYVKCVIPWEMSKDWPVEALKAQAVCARTYAVCQTKHRAQGFDICATTHCQVYQGTAASGANSDAAVDQTAGEFLYYSGRLVQEAVYYSSNGGASEDSLNVWGNDVGYLKSKIDPYEGKIASIIPQYNWSTTFTASELTTLLNNRGYGIGTVKNAYVSAYTDTGNVYSITFTGTSGSKTIVREACRSLLNLRSQRFTIGGGGSENAYSVNDTGESVALSAASAVDSSGKRSALSGNVYVITSSGTSQLEQRTTTSGSGSFVISGSGYGHNVGMSQWGAYSMANLGYSYRDILQFYYTDVSIR